MAAALGLACALLTAGCSDDFSPTEPSWAPALSSHELESAEGTWESWDIGSLDSGSWDSEYWEEVARELYRWLVESGLSWTTTEASAVIGREGGALILWADPVPGVRGRPYHSLTVPPDAVRKPTLFVMTLGPDPAIDVHLSATEVSSGKAITRFKTPLSLVLTYEGSSAEASDGLTIVHVVDGNVREVVTSTVDADRRIVIGEIRHFSRYAVACE
jgi:hypothetical protein